MDVENLQSDIERINGEMQLLEYIKSPEFKRLWPVFEAAIDWRMVSFAVATESKLGVGVDHAYMNGKKDEDLWLKRLPETIYGVKQAELKGINRKLKKQLDAMKEKENLLDEK